MYPLFRVGIAFAASAWISSAVASEPSLAPSFDCKKATSTVEKLICTNIVHNLGPLDSTMAIAFHAALANTSNKTELLAQQRQWLATRGEGCNLPTDPDAPYAQQDQASICLKAKYDEKIAQLREEAVRATGVVSSERLGRGRDH